MNNKEIRQKLKTIHGGFAKLEVKQVHRGKKKIGSEVQKDSYSLSDPTAFFNNFNLDAVGKLVTSEDHLRSLAHLDRHLQVEYVAPMAFAFGTDVHAQEQMAMAKRSGDSTP